jgi:hypothetical protein
MLGEELKQLIYAHHMGLTHQEINGKPYIFDLEGKTIVDIGGGPNSLLLKCINFRGAVIDPCDYPNWVATRYSELGIDYIKQTGEDVSESILESADEVWIYNVLQHTIDPEKIIKKAKLAKKIRIFEWIDAEQNHAHPHVLTEEKLNEWLGGKGKIETFNGINGCYGKAFYGTF